MPKLQTPQVLSENDQKVQLYAYMKKNNICTFEEFLEAVEKNDVRKVQTLNYLDAHLSFKNQFGFTPLHIAVRNNNTDILNVLLKEGANLEVMDNEGRTPLHLAAFNGDSHVTIAKLLIENNANIEAKTKKQTLAGHEGCTPLHVAAEYDFHGQSEMIKFLLSKKANLEAGNDLGCTPLQWAVVKGAIAGVKILLSHGANLEAQMKEGGGTPLYLAALNNHAEIVALLLEQGANLNTSANEGPAPIDIAHQKGHEEVVKILLQKGAKLTERANSKLTGSGSVRPESFHFMKGKFNQRAVKALHNLEKERLQTIIKKIVPGKDWNFDSSGKIWLRLTDEEEAKKIVRHFEANGYNAIKLSREKNASNFIIILEKVECDQLKDIPSLQFFDKEQEEKVNYQTTPMLK